MWLTVIAAAVAIAASILGFLAGSARYRATAARRGTIVA
jgi:hypothetical protein